MDDSSSLAEDMLAAIVVKLVQRGVLGRDDLLDISDGFRRQGKAASDPEQRYKFEELAHTANCLILEAEKPGDSEWTADEARSRFHVDKSDGRA